MLLATINEVPGKNFEVLGIVEGSSVESTNIGKDIGAAFKNLVGGELKSYTEMMDKSRAVAKERLIQQANRLNADAILGIRYGSSSISQSAAEIVIYGTAVKFI